MHLKTACAIVPKIPLRPAQGAERRVQALAVDGGISAIKEAVDLHLRLLAKYLLNGNNTGLAWGRVGGKDNADPIVAAAGAIALAFVRNRICAPRYMSAGAATAFRAAVDQVLALLH